MDKLSVEQLREVVSLLPDPAFILSIDGTYLAYLGGVDHDAYHDGCSLVGKSLNAVLPAPKAAWFTRQIQLALTERRVQVVEYDLDVQEVEGVAPQGPHGMLHFEGKVMPLNSLFNGRPAVLWLTRNITERYQLEIKLRKLSETDGLTGLFNRRYMLACLGQQLLRLGDKERFSALVLVDIDHFKRINDNFGHPVGDLVIKQVAHGIGLQLRDGDVAARIGGEEFAILLTRTRLEEALAVAERIRHAIATQEVHAANERVNMTISLGVTQLVALDTVSSMMARADKALYHAKTCGRNQIQYS
ncbi:sensor domain-containing diguanylate cyclase [Shewanella sp. NIFS-20-20]|uniref:GGDEF domain-containing protein n=1 Tax=Shewanella sp. NIFS-20-20 TaxID=2853806 RepID=UPI001C4728A1|nr:sensor domain-containing diguanylate cyclase [Shewanella sp. NIFS-20-20]MBV7317393.1 GGDEF domain-containing protein [Shewanella sp. NIFS-20-20]